MDREAQNRSRGDFSSQRFQGFQGGGFDRFGGGGGFGVVIAAAVEVDLVVVAIDSVVDGGGGFGRFGGGGGGFRGRR